MPGLWRAFPAVHMFSPNRELCQKFLSDGAAMIPTRAIGATMACVMIGRTHQQGEAS